LGVLVANGCAGSWNATFPIQSEFEPGLRYNAVAVVPLKPLGGQRQSREADLASEMLLRLLRARSPFAIFHRLVDLMPAEVQGPLQIEGQTVDGLLTGRLRFSRRDRSSWERTAERSSSSQGQPVFSRRTALRLDLRVELRNLSTGRLDLTRSYAQEVLLDNDATPREREAFRALLGVVLGRLMDELAPPPALEKRALLPWNRHAAGRQR
jgi:hypothetical protein